MQPALYPSAQLSIFEDSSRPFGFASQPATLAEGSMPGRTIPVRRSSPQGVLTALDKAAPTHQKRIIENALEAGILPSALRLPGARLKGIQLAGALRAQLQHSDLLGADLSGGRIWADLSGSDLSQSRLVGADLHGSRFAGINAVSANLSGADCRGVVFLGSDFRNARLDHLRAALTDFSECDLRGASLLGADLSGTLLRGSDLSRAVVRGVYFGGCTVSAVELGRASLAPIRSRIEGLLDTYPAIVPVWMDWLRSGRWPVTQGKLARRQPPDRTGLSGLVSSALGYRVGAGWQCTPGGTEWIIWQFVRSIEKGELPQRSAVAWWLYEWLRLRHKHHQKAGFTSRIDRLAARRTKWKRGNDLIGSKHSSTV